MKRMIVGLSVMALGTTIVAAAPAGRREVRRRQHHQARRINQGVRSGELTKEEAKSLRAEEKDIRGMRKEAMSDGHMTHQEVKDINAAENKASQDIYNEKHDAEKR